MGEEISEDDRTTGLGLVRYALEHFAGALATHTVLEGDWRVGVTSAAPVYSLSGQAIELGLKAFLRERGETPRDLRKKFRHNLIKALDAAEVAGLSHAADRDQLALLNDEYDQYRFRYIRTGFVRLLEVNHLFQLTANILRPCLIAIPGAYRFMWQPGGKYLSEAGLLSATEIRRASKE